ncbi:hypothetical protein ABZ770_07775 [Streptomyces sp. NPDC006654]|uniref:hypothetical protein n=1 Tax=Streptomyces sp. NPDC006654 TaxID=3156897 RepID=UPI0033DCFC22
MDERALILSRIAALVAVDAPAVSYLAHVNPAVKAEFTAGEGEARYGPEGGAR